VSQTRPAPREVQLSRLGPVIETRPRSCTRTGHGPFLHYETVVSVCCGYHIMLYRYFLAGHSFVGFKISIKNDDKVHTVGAIPCGEGEEYTEVRGGGTGGKERERCGVGEAAAARRRYTNVRGATPPHSRRHQSTLSIYP